MPSLIAEEIISPLPGSQLAKYRNRENFPVASWLLPPRYRRAILAFYHFARGADEIADAPDLDVEAKERLLRTLDNALQDPDQPVPDWAEAYLALIRQGQCSPAYSRALLSAFLQDLHKPRYETWDDLMDYCRRSAVPVGKAVLEICQEYKADQEAAEALCIALQLLNHVQDCKEDYVLRNRVYLPLSLFYSLGADPAALIAASTPSTLRQVLDAVLYKAEEKLRQARELLPTLHSFWLRLEIGWTISMATHWCRKLQRLDILAESGKLTHQEKWKSLLSFFTSSPEWFLPAFTPRLGHKPALARKSSFFIPMLLMGKERRKGLLCLYAFCQALDHSVDNAHDRDAVRASLQFWREEVEAIFHGQPTQDVSLAMQETVQLFSLTERYFNELLSGLEMDHAGIMHMPKIETLETYCYRVASTVGLLSCEIFGCTNPNSRKLAMDFGHGMQRVNILRDIEEDLERGRIYLPYEWLAEVHITSMASDTLPYYAPTLKAVCEHMAHRAKAHFQRAQQFLSQEDKRKLLPALLMRDVYLSLLRKMQKEGWHIGQRKRPYISLLEQCWIALKGIRYWL